MIEESEKSKYCFDTSALINSWRLYYRPNLFGGLWERIGDGIMSGRILIPDEVRKEVGDGKDPLISWLKQYQKYIVPLSQEQIEIASNIVNKYPLASKYKKPRPHHADPIVIAVASLYSCTVVTYEGLNGDKKNPAIPDLCNEYGVECLSMSGFFEKEGLSFKL